MKLIAFFAVVLCAFFFLSGTNALPLEGEQLIMDGAAVQQPEPYDQPEEHSRQKRATCDLLSGTGVNHSACAAHCVLLRHKGGYCNSKAVCVCRD